MNGPAMRARDPLAHECGVRNGAKRTRHGCFTPLTAKLRGSMIRIVSFAAILPLKEGRAEGLRARPA